MADKLNFSLVSPARELFSGAVDQVNVPGTEGDFGVLPNHSPFMAAIRTGIVSVVDGGTRTDYFIAGGFADVMPDGLTILAERASVLADLDKEALAEELNAAEAALAELVGDAELDARQNIDGLRQLVG